MREREVQKNCDSCEEEAKKECSESTEEDYISPLTHRKYDCPLNRKTLSNGFTEHITKRFEEVQ